MSGIDQRKFHEITLSHGAQKDVCLFAPPNYPDCLRLVVARLTASGYTDGDREAKVDEPTGTPNGADLMAVYWATVGLCWTGERLETTFRGTTPPRDVVAYGEAVVTEFRGRGFDPDELFEAGRALYDWMMTAVFGDSTKPGAMEQVRSEASFSEAPTEQPTVGAH